MNYKVTDKNAPEAKQNNKKQRLHAKYPNLPYETMPKLILCHFAQGMCAPAKSWSGGGGGGGG